MEDNIACANAFSNIMSVSAGATPDPLQVIFVSSGKAVNDLGNYKYCENAFTIYNQSSNYNLSYSLVTISNKASVYD